MIFVNVGYGWLAGYSPRTETDVSDVITASGEASNVSAMVMFKGGVKLHAASQRPDEKLTFGRQLGKEFSSMFTGFTSLFHLETLVNVSVFVQLSSLN